MPIEIGPDRQKLETLKLNVGDKWRGVLVDINEVPHYKFGTEELEQEIDAAGKPKTKWIARLRPQGATSSSTDLEWWTQNQTKYALREAIRPHNATHIGGEIGIERLADSEPKNKVFKGAHNYRVVIIKAGPTNWADPFNNAPVDEPEEDPF
jgi:hypothetical protein